MGDLQIFYFLLFLQLYLVGCSFQQFLYFNHVYKLLRRTSLKIQLQKHKLDILKNTGNKGKLLRQRFITRARLKYETVEMDIYINIIAKKYLRNFVSRV